MGKIEVKRGRRGKKWRKRHVDALAGHNGPRVLGFIDASRKGAKKNRKKLTHVSLFVCMSAGNSDMLVFLSVFFPTMRIFHFF